MSPGSRGSPMPSRPPHLPHPRSRSLDTALDKASDASAPTADSTPQCSSVAGSLTGSLAGSITGSLADSTVPDSVPATDSQADAALPSDTDASDSGISNRCSESSREVRRKDSIRSKHTSSSKDSNIRSSFRRAHGHQAGSKDDLRSSGRLKNRNVKSSSNDPSGKEKPSGESKVPLKSALPRGGDARKGVKTKTPARADQAAPKYNPNRSLFNSKENDNNAKEIDPYNNFLNKKVGSAIKKFESEDKKSPFREHRTRKISPLAAGLNDPPKRDVQTSNPYISPLISTFNRKEKSPQPSCSSSSSSPVPSSITSGLRSPSLISSSSTASLPQRRKESVFSFPAKTNTLTDFSPSSVASADVSSNVNTVIPPPSRDPSYLEAAARAPPHRTLPLENTSAQKLSPPEKTELNTSPFPTPKAKAKLIREIDLHKEGSHLDLVAACEQYLEDERQQTSDDESTLASTRRSSISSLGSINGRRRRRLSSIPLDDELTIAEEDHHSTDLSRDSPAKSSPTAPHEMAIFSAIAALSQSGAVSEQTDDTDSCGEYEGCSLSPSTLSSSSKTEQYSASSSRDPSVLSSVSGSAIPPSSPSRSNALPIFSGQPGPGKSSTLQRMTSADSSSSQAASLLDKCVSKVKTFIKK